jgi:hypothetical protein
MTQFLLINVRNYKSSKHQIEDETASTPWEYGTQMTKGVSIKI